MSIRSPQTRSQSRPVAVRSGRWNRLVGSIVEAALSPHPVDRYLELLDPMLTWRDLRGEIVRVEHPTARTVRLTIRPTRQWRGHRAGQFVQLSAVIDGVRHTRCFSPANAGSGPDGTIELTVTANEDGLVSKHLARHARPGDVVGLSQADGEFVLPETDPASAVFISGGSGITPVTLNAEDARIAILRRTDHLRPLRTDAARCRLPRRARRARAGASAAGPAPALHP